MFVIFVWLCEVCDCCYLYSWVFVKCEFGKCVLYLGLSVWWVFILIEVGKGECGSFLKIVLELKLKED